MRLKVLRYEYTSTYTAGELLIDDVHFCWTIEDTDRLGRGEKKVMHETCIPEGTYKVITSFSNRFKKELPLILDVPQFEGIRIHGGNGANASSGCLILGMTKTDKNGFLGMSKIAMNLLMKRLEGQKDVTIEIVKKQDLFV